MLKNETIQDKIASQGGGKKKIYKIFTVKLLLKTGLHSFYMERTRSISWDCPIIS